MKNYKRWGMIVIICLLALILGACGSIDMEGSYPAEENSAERTVQEPEINDISNQWGGIKLQWDEVPEYEQYYVYRKNDNEDWQLITSTGMTEFIDEKVENESVYTYSISIYSENDVNKSNLDERSKTVTYYEAPNDLVVSCTPEGINLRWTSNNSIGKYRLLKREIVNVQKEITSEKDDAMSTSELPSEESTFEMANNQEKTLKEDKGNGSSEEDSALEIDNPEKNEENENVPSEATTGTEDYVEDGIADSKEQEDILLNADQEERPNESEWEELKIVSDSYYDDTEVENSHCYAYTICCVNESDEDISSHDPEGKTIIFFESPKDIRLKNTESGVNIQWNQVEGVNKYRIYRRITPAGTAGDNDTETDKFEESTTEYNDLTLPAENDTSTEGIANEEASSEIQETPQEAASTESQKAVENEETDSVPVSNGWEILADVETEQYVDSSVENNTSYDYTISCIDQDGTEEISAHDPEGRSVRFYAAPKELKASNVTDGIHLTWNPVEGISAYQVYRADAEGIFQKYSISDTTDFTDADVSGGQVYKYTVGCMDAEKAHIISAFDSSGKEIMYVRTPDELNVRNVAGAVSFNWNKSEGAEKYRVLRKNAEGTWEKKTDTEGNSFVDSDVTIGTEYHYSVCCIDKDEANEISAFDPEGVAIVFYDAPGDMQAVNTQDGVKVSWKAIEGIASYQIYRAVGSGEFQKLDVSDSAEYVDKTAKSGQAYKYTASCMNQDKTAEVSAYNATGKDVLYLAAPENINTQNTLKGISVSWDKSEGAEKYQVLRKNKDGKWEKLSDTNKQTIIDKDVKSGKKYAYTVKCINKDGTQELSAYNTNGRTQLFLSPIIEKKVKIKNKEDGISISWPKVAGANCYVIYRGTSEKDLKTIGTVDVGNQTDYYDQKTKNGESYIYAVQSRCKYEDGEAVGAYTGKKAVRLKGTSIESLDAKTEAFTVEWKGNDKASYYEIQYGTDKSFKKKSRTASASGDKRSKTIRDLNVEKYYVRVRVCKVVDDKDYYSGWTDRKSVTPKEEKVSTYYETKTEPVTYKSKYIANINTKKFHLPDCRDLRRMKESNKREYTATRDEMIALGYSPCGHCHP